ncbi:hypothetical protein JX265_006611 [Neoarthrinium moseri]|uniref:DUF1742-domain-containing protein n=1 Tax=Neoarthrinium moseri TaxID=1658444 RepID=A0A9P9WLE0_9PEZI|nr:hypothetical protein JX265_006611 [Neoarthrinium moseri]
MSIPNVWHHRKVADAAAKACDICYRPSTSVLVTPEKQDFFYICPVHLKDTKFATPIIDHEAIAAKKKKEMDEELERVKKEYEEKQRKKKEKANADDKSKSEDKDKDAKDQEKKDGSKSKDEASPVILPPVLAGRTDFIQQARPDPATPQEEEPRVFALQKSFHQQRINKKQQAELAKRNRERLANPNLFPSVPKGVPGPQG